MRLGILAADHSTLGRCMAPPVGSCDAAAVTERGLCAAHHEHEGHVRDGEYAATCAGCRA